MAIQMFNRKLVFIMLLIVGGILVGAYIIPSFNRLSMVQTSRSESLLYSDSALGMPAPAYQKSIGMPDIVSPEVAPVEAESRLVIRDTSLSLVVADVPKSLSSIEKLANEAGGFLVDSHLSIPESAANGTITIRVPESKRALVLEAMKALGIKTVSENVNGQDVTDQYVDNAARMETLLKTKAKFESVLDQAVRIQDILEVQRELINLQSQIDALKGRQQYLEQSAKLVRITVHLSTDEYSLPYTPAQSWRPEVIVKQAVRSLIAHVRSLGTLAIWLLVYTPVWLPVLIGGWWYRRRSLKKSIAS